MTDESALNDSWFRSARNKLLKWFAANHRSLPWRETNDPYKVWVSEIMLQQTQVSTVIPYFHRFLDRFPTVDQLASSQESDVLHAWSGLGYYRRARQMHAAAKELVEFHGSEFPRDIESLMSLHGIGRYTAGAILSFAFNVPAPIVEANTKRLYARLIGLTKPIDGRDSVQALWHFAERIISKSKEPKSINSALMDFGATVCKPTPDCSECVLKSFCRAYQDGTQNLIPAAKRKIQFESRIEGALLIRNSNGQFLIRQCGPNEWWTGLWDFPRYELAMDQSPKKQLDYLQDCVHRQFGLKIEINTEGFVLKHAVTKYRIELRCFETIVTLSSKKALQVISDSESTAWVTPHSMNHYALSSSGKKIVQKLIQPQS